MEKTARIGRQIDKQKMKKIIKRFLSIICITFVITIFATPTIADSTGNIVTGDIGDFGTWTTEHNQNELLNNVKNDLNAFESEYGHEYVEAGVPIEARLGIVFVRALSYVSQILDSSLVRFVNIFLVIAFIFWVMLYAYQMITDGGKTKPMDAFQEIAKKGAILAIWLILLGGGIQWFFGAIMGPIFGFSSYVSNLILNATTESGGYALADNCAAIHTYATTHLGNNQIFTPEFAANIMCVPARLSGFYYGAIKFGWNLVVSGLGVSTFTLLVGLILVCLFIYTAFKFMFVAFGVVADLFLVIIMLPFTAIAETVNKTSYKGIAGDVYNGFLGLFKSSNLSSQIKKFVDASIYFISLSIIIAIAGALLASAVQLNSDTHLITVLNGDVVTLLLTGALVAYLAAHADEFAKTIGGAIDYAIGSDLQKDLKTVYNDTKKKAEAFIKALKESKK